MAHKKTTSHTQHYSATVGARGRMVLPAKLRERLGLEEGDRLVLTLRQDGSVELTPLREAVRRVRGMYAHVAPGRSLVDELTSERREEALREETD